MACKLWFYDNRNRHSLHSSMETTTTEQGESERVYDVGSGNCHLDSRPLGQLHADRERKLEPSSSPTRVTSSWPLCRH